MPNTNRDQTMYVQTGNPDSWSMATLQRPGELGKAYDFNDRAYQRVKTDSGATASNTVGVVAANQLAFWKSRADYLVTNDKRQSLLGAVANSFMLNVAGVFRSAVPAGYYCDVLIRGRNIPVSVATADEGNMLGGAMVIADITADTASADGVAVGGTATPYQRLGYVRTASTSNVAYVDFDIPNIP
jgi:predicted N-acetyltransferase YhbS